MQLLLVLELLLDLVDAFGEQMKVLLLVLGGFVHVALGPHRIVDEVVEPWIGVDLWVLGGENRLHDLLYEVFAHVRGDLLVPRFALSWRRRLLVD